ncbi:MAG TPA: amidohydrolase family protein [Blastocatellia bacterium]|nr:amidohydrolase family protein [Blastocatellia bacterium]
MLKRYSSLTLAFALALSILSVWAAVSPQVQRAAAFDGDAYAIKGGTVVTVTGATIQKGTVIIRNGLIEAVGADIPIPGDARVIDATGMTVYPGLIDAYTNIGLGAAAPTPAQGGRGRGAPDPTTPANPALAIAAGASVAQPTPTPAGQSPELMASDELKVTAETFDQQRSAGITTALVAPREGIYQGQSALINLGAAEPEKLIIKNPVSLNVSFGTGRGFGGGYPSSLMGVFAFLRQSMLDAQHYKSAWDHYNRNKRGMQRPETDKSLAALQPVIAGAMPVAFTANSEREIKRAIGLGEEFGLKFLIAGGLQSYQVADLLKQKNVTVLLSLNYPQRPANLEDPESEPLRVLRDRAAAPTSAAALHKAGVRFAFQSGYLNRPSDYITNAAKAIEAGLPKDEAIKAMTIYPAEIFGVAEQLGSIEKGKIANIVVTSGDLFDRRSQVKHVFVDGKPYEIKPPAPTQAGPGGRFGGRGGRPGAANAGGSASAAVSAAGSWTITSESPQGPIQLTFNLKQEDATISGEVASPFGTFPLSGSLSGNELSFAFTAKIQDQEVAVTGKGSIDGNSIRGTITAMGHDSDFSGTRTPR